MHSKEHERLEEPFEGPVRPWRKWGPYLPERSWGTVREDYSANGDAWESFPHELARNRVFRWGEDGIAGWSDRYQILTLSWAFWNEKDPILKERLFGLSHAQGNHGEDVKEYYFYLDALPTHSYMKYLYKYPQNAYPYQELIQTNRNRNADESEFELVDTGIFNENRYFDIFLEFAKESPEDLCIRIEAVNRGDTAAPLHLLGQLCFRNHWAWGDKREPEPIIQPGSQTNNYQSVIADDTNTDSLSNLLFDYHLNKRYFYGPPDCEVLFTNNEDPYTGKAPFKGAFHEAVIEKKPTGAHEGTKASLYCHAKSIPPRQSIVWTFRLTDQEMKDPLKEIEKIILEKKKQADAFYEKIHPPQATEEEKAIQRQAFAGMLWSKQSYIFDVDRWLQGDRASTPPPESRSTIRNTKWRHLNTMRILSVPDKWEFPWFAAWDLAFHCLSYGLLDIEFAKEQLWYLLFDQFQHPNGQIPAYEWEFSEMNPPIQAWVAWQLFQMEEEKWGKKDYHFLKKCFDKLLINFAWWVNRVDSSGYNVFEGGFLGLDNIGLIDRSDTFHEGSRLEQSDGTGWMALFCLNLMRMALALTKQDASYESLATKFFQHYVYIAKAMKKRDGVDYGLWNEEDGFFYDILVSPDGTFNQFRVRSLVGLIPINAVEALSKEELDACPEFSNNFNWFCKNRKNLVESCVFPMDDGSYLLSIVDESHLRRMLEYVWKPEEFRSPFGLRSLSKFHEENPVAYQDSSIGYEPGEAKIRIKGGNSNWRGPIWFPMNYFLIFSLRKFASTLNKPFSIHIKGEKSVTLQEMAESFANRLISIYQENQEGIHPYRTDFPLAKDPHWKPYLNFHEYFHAESGKGLGASHQTGWTGLIANLIDQYRR